jgi:hypothetical protein
MTGPSRDGQIPARIIQAAEKLCFVSGHDFGRAVND